MTIVADLRFFCMEDNARQSAPYDGQRRLSRGDHDELIVGTRTPNMVSPSFRGRITGERWTDVQRTRLFVTPTG